MGIPVLEKGCCGCCSIPTCVKVQAWLKMITAVLGVIDTIAYFAQKPQNIDSHSQEDVHKMQSVVGLFMYILQILLAALLIQGVYKSSHRYIKPYLYAEAVTMALLALIIIVSLFLNLLAGAVFVLLVLLLDVYFWLHVYSLYESLKQESQAINQPEHPNYAGGGEPTYQGYQSPTSGYVPPVPAQNMVP